MLRIFQKTFILLLVCQFGFGQVDYFNEEVKAPQTARARAVISALEEAEVDLTISAFDTSIVDLKTDLALVSSEILKVKDIAKLSIVIVFEPGFNVYRFRYYNDTGELYQIDLFMSEGEPKSKIKKIETKNSTVLKAEHDERMKTKDYPPPPPPPSPH